MPRYNRKCLVGNYFHIMVQGVNKEFIFNNETDKAQYLKMIIKFKAGYNFKILAYAIMGNHVHLLFFTNNFCEISEFMQKLNTSYGLYFNKKYERIGHVFRDRFKTQPIMDRAHLTACLVYIHNNPIKAGITQTFESYKFSSYHEYLSKHYVISEDAESYLWDEKDIEKYKKDFIEIHKHKYLENINDIEGDRVNPKELYHMLLKRNYNIFQIITFMREEYKFSQEKIAQCLNINRYSLNKIINDENLQKGTVPFCKNKKRS